MTVPDHAVQLGAEALDDFGVRRDIAEEYALAVLEAASEEIDCPDCKGKGKVRNPMELGPGQHINTFSSVPCEVCRGSGRLHILRKDAQ